MPTYIDPASLVTPGPPCRECCLCEQYVQCGVRRTKHGGTYLVGYCALDGARRIEDEGCARWEPLREETDR